MIEEKFAIAAAVIGFLVVLYIAAVALKYLTAKYLAGRKKPESGKDSWNYITDRIEAENSGESKSMQEIVAAISAVLYAAFLGRPGYKLEVKSIKRVPQNTPVWNEVGKIERINSKING